MTITAFQRFLLPSAFLTFTLGLAGCSQGTFFIQPSAAGDAPSYGSVRLSGSALSFPDVALGAAPANLSVQASNSTPDSTRAFSFIVSGDYQIASNSCPAVLPGQSSCAVTISFSPTAVGSRQGSLTLKQSSGNTLVSLNGNGVAMHHTLTLSVDATHVRDGEYAQINGLVDGVASTDLVWSLSDLSGTSGSLSSGGVFTAPLITPASGSVTISATYKLDASVSSKISIPVWDALPSLTSFSPTLLWSGPQQVALRGTGLDKVSKVMVDGKSVDFTKGPDGSIQIREIIAPWASGSTSIDVSMDGEQGGLSNTVTIPIRARALSYDAAARFAEQASFGATPSRIESLQSQGLAAWIDQQLKNPKFDYTALSTRFSVAQWYRNAQNDSYSLRQRVALVLQQQFVTGTRSMCFEPSECGPLWEDMLERDAFGNARTLLKDVVQSMIMGFCLDNAENFASPNGPPPNQNMARELLQLMTIGTVQLNQNGTPITDLQGNGVPTYDQGNVVAVTAALTGWRSQSNLVSNLYSGLPGYTGIVPMYSTENLHDQGAKTILPGVTISPAQGAVADLKNTLDALYLHPNFAPFLSKRLIQGLVKSDPSGEYVGRISAVFNDDGTGTRGNLGATVKAILLDPEARKGDDPTTVDSTAGHLAEPLLYLTSMMNAVNGTYTDEEIQGIDKQMGEGIYQTPSVFGYFSPSHQLADGTPAPEAELLDGVYSFNKMSTTYEILNNSKGGFWVDWTATPFWNSASEGDLLDLINHLLYHGTLSSQNRSVLSTYIESQPSVKLNALLPNILFLAFTNTSFQVFR